MKKHLETIRDGAKGATSKIQEKLASATEATVAAGSSVAIKSKQALQSASTATGKAARAAGGAAAKVGGVAAETAATIGTTLLDQNGDGKVDQSDVKLLTERATALVKSTAKQVASSELAKDAAAGAAVGAAIAVPVPLVGPVAGATLGAAIGAMIHLRKKK